MISDDGAVVCDKCGCRSDAASEEQAEAFGWLVDVHADPHVHTCPACRDASDVL